MVLLIFIGIIRFWVMSHKEPEANNNETDFTEYTPQEEISNTQLRQTLVTLYFKNKETGDITPEARMIDSKILLNNPYNELINLLIEGPKNESLEKLIPKETKLNNVNIQKGIVYIDFSEEFTNVENLGAEEENKIICSIVNTLTELTEVSGIKILINGEENKGFSDEGLKFNETFVRQESSAT